MRAFRYSDTQLPLDSQKSKADAGRERAIDCRHGNLPVSESTYTFSRNTHVESLTDAINSKELYPLQTHSNHASAAQGNSIVAVLTIGSRFKLASEPRVAET